MSDISLVWDSANNRGDWVLAAAGVTSTPVTVSGAQFGVGDGVTSQFYIVPPTGTQSDFVGQVRRRDWQGNVRLYAVPRTNGVRQSQNFGDASWAKSNASVVASAVVAPDGVSTMWKIVEDNTNNPHYTSRVDMPLSAGNQYTCAAFARAAERRFFCLGWRNGANWVGGQPSATFDLVLGTVNFVGNGATARIRTLPDGSYRCEVTATCSTSQNSGPFLQLLAAGGTIGVGYLGDGVSGLYAWGAQGEPTIAEDGFSTSYVATGSTPTTVTDYQLSSNGLVTLSVVPLAGASLTWTGSYITGVFNEGGFLQEGNDVTTALLLSLFTDRMADLDDVIPDGTTDPRGWWADDVSVGKIGSRMWLIFREKQTKETLQRAYDYIVEAIQWMIDDKVVARFDINVSWIKRGQLGAQITAYKQDGAIVPNSFTWAWQGSD